MAILCCLLVVAIFFFRDSDWAMEGCMGGTSVLLASGSNTLLQGQ